MLLLTAIDFSIGALLGTKFRVWILLPCMILGLAAILVIATVNSISGIRSLILAQAIGLQLGYLIGSAARQIGSGGQMDAISHNGLSQGDTVAPPTL